MQTGSDTDPAGFSPSMLLFRWAHHDYRPRLIVDQSLRLHWANEAASAELARQRELIERHGRLAFVDDNSQSEFIRFIGQIKNDVATFCAHGADGDGHVIISVQELASSKASRFLGLMVRRAGGEARTISAGLDQAFDLTPAEMKVLEGLLGGNTADEISAEHHKTLATVRSHIKSIYSKLDVRSREALFHKVRPFILPP